MYNTLYLCFILLLPFPLPLPLPFLLPSAKSHAIPRKVEQTSQLGMKPHPNAHAATFPSRRAHPAVSHMGLGWRDASVVAPELIQKPRVPSDVLSMFGASTAPVLAIDFSYRFLDLGFKGEFEYFDGKKEWTPPRVRLPKL